MVGTCLLLGFLLVATATDLARGKIYNWTTYPGIVLAVILSAVATVASEQITAAAAGWWGLEEGTAEEQIGNLLGLAPLGDALLGLFACGLIMLVCYVSFPNGIGGGDIKLIAMIGAFLGLHAGLTALLWTFVFGGCTALIMLVWRFGAWNLVCRGWRLITYAWRAGPTAELSEEERKPLKSGLYLAPSAALAVVVVRFYLVEWLMSK